jgi:hypothetical protein
LYFRWESKMYGIWSNFSTFSRFWAFYLEASIWFRVRIKVKGRFRIRFKVTSRIRNRFRIRFKVTGRIRIRINVMRIPNTFSSSRTSLSIPPLLGSYSASFREQLGEGFCLSAGERSVSELGQAAVRQVPLGRRTVGKAPAFRNEIPGRVLTEKLS